MFNHFFQLQAAGAGSLCFAAYPCRHSEVQEQIVPIPRNNSWSGTERRVESSPELAASRRLREPGGVLEKLLFFEGPSGVNRDINESR